MIFVFIFFLFYDDIHFVVGRRASRRIVIEFIFHYLSNTYPE